MLDMFLYNWQVREDWFTWCESLPQEELLKERIGGMKSILKNLYHVIDCEQLWVNQMKRTPVFPSDIHAVSTLGEVREFSERTKAVTEDFLKNWTSDLEKELLVITNNKGKMFSFHHGKILRHILSHEIHHMGQLSIWARDIGKAPVSSDLLSRDF